jgi:8-oxo-dGTP pyrophosphatase MutT (NUDIX family)
VPHIHTQPNQHDITTSAFIILRGEGEDKLLTHMHRKYNVLMQIGGHIELDETPWQTLAHELLEESGYDVTDLKVLQPNADIPSIYGAVVHPAPFMMNTHKIGEDHYHSDLCFAFVASSKPTAAPAEGESTDLRWNTLSELKSLAESGEALRDIVEIYEQIVSKLDSYIAVDCSKFSLDKPIGGSL